MAERKTTHVAIQRSDYLKAKAVHTDLERILGKRVLFQDVSGRAIEALADNHERGAWLSPSEAAATMRKRQEAATKARVGKAADNYTVTALGRELLEAVRLDFRVLFHRVRHGGNRTPQQSCPCPQL